MGTKPETRVRSDGHMWRVDCLFLGLIWVPVGRWIHQDWWAPYEFATANDADAFRLTGGPPAQEPRMELMVVTITKPGRLPSEQTIATWCRRCRCEFTFNPPDARYVNDQRDGDFYTIACPTCKAPVHTGVPRT